MTPTPKLNVPQRTICKYVQASANIERLRFARKRKHKTRRRIKKWFAVFVKCCNELTAVLDI